MILHLITIMKKVQNAIMLSHLFTCKNENNVGSLGLDFFICTME